MTIKWRFLYLCHILQIKNASRESLTSAVLQSAVRKLTLKDRWGVTGFKCCRCGREWTLSARLTGLTLHGLSWLSSSGLESGCCLPESFSTKTNTSHSNRNSARVISSLCPAQIHIQQLIRRSRHTRNKQPSSELNVQERNLDPFLSFILSD